MNERESKGTAPPGAAAGRARHTRLAALALVLATSGLGAEAVQAESPGMQMRRARFALAGGSHAAAAADLEAVRRAEPSTARGLEAAMLLADLRFSAGRADEADAVLADASRAAPATIATPIHLSRAWLSLSRGRLDEARARFGRVRGSDAALARDVAEIGLVWSAPSGSEPIDLEPLRAVAGGSGPPALRVAAGWTLARAHAAADDHRRGLRELRRLRRDVRGTSLEDDLELLLGLAQLDAGRSRDALRTFRRLERRHGAPGRAGPPSGGLRLADLRLSNEDLVDRVSALYGARTTRSVGLMRFLGLLFDRDAAHDAPEAISLAERSLAAQKGGAR